MVLDPRVIALVDVPLAAVEDLPGQPMAALLQVADALDVRPVGLVVQESQDVEGLEDPAPGGDRLAQRGRVAVALQRPYHVVGTDRPGVDGRGDPQDVRPVPADPAAGDGYP